jgi:hypothetical protein
LLHGSGRLSGTVQLGLVVFVLRVAYGATPIIRAVRADVAIRFRGFRAVRLTQEKLFAHLDEARTAKFAVQKIENGGQDRALRGFEIASRYHIFGVPHVNRITKHAIYFLQSVRRAPNPLTAAFPRHQSLIRPALSAGLFAFGSMLYLDGTN